MSERFLTVGITNELRRDRRCRASAPATCYTPVNGGCQHESRFLQAPLAELLGKRDNDALRPADVGSRYVSSYCISPMSSAPWARKRATTASMSSTANMTRRMPSVFTGASTGPNLIALGVWNLSSSMPCPSGVRIIARVARTS